MNFLSSYILSLILSTFPPGNKAHSYEPVSGCGNDPNAPTCELAPVCPENTILCAPPKWIDGIGWARVETRVAGARRLEVVADAIADSAQFHGAGWPEGPVDLARAIVAASGWSTGFREDIQVGRKRGPAGEVCLADVMVKTLRAAVPYELARLPEAELVDRVTGLDYASLRNCFDAGAVLITRARRWAAARCKSFPITYSMFAAYGTGSQCHTYGLHGDYARLRQATFERFRNTKHTTWPEWYQPRESRGES